MPDVGTSSPTLPSRRPELATSSRLKVRNLRIKRLRPDGELSHPKPLPIVTPRLRQARRPPNGAPSGENNSSDRTRG